MTSREQDHQPGRDAPASGSSLGIVILRYGLPALLLIAGIAAIIAGRAKTAIAGAGVVLLGIALMVAMLNWLFRLSVRSNEDRERDERARDHFARTGRWPEDDEELPVPGPGSAGPAAAGPVAAAGPAAAPGPAGEAERAGEAE
jgi:hypothetical protein